MRFITSVYLSDHEKFDLPYLLAHFCALQTVLRVRVFEIGGKVHSR